MRPSSTRRRGTSVKYRRFGAADGYHQISARDGVLGRGLLRLVAKTLRCRSTQTRHIYRIDHADAVERVLRLERRNVGTALRPYPEEGHFADLFLRLPREKAG